MNLFDDIKHNFRQGDNLIRLIYINLAVFLLIKVLFLFSFLFQTSDFSIAHWLSVPASFAKLLLKPWTIITYMFLHEDFLHILFNLLWLYFGGRIFLDFLGEKRLLSTYILGGISGGLLYVLSFNLFPVFSGVLPVSMALGASASVLAILIAISTYIPNYAVRLLFLGEIKLKYIAIISVVMDIISIPSSNSGGHIAHLGGALFGYLYVKQYQKGKDWSIGFYKWFSALGSLFKPSKRRTMKVAYKRKGNKKNKETQNQDVNQEKIDIILDKISKSGYDSLTKEEKETLFKASNNS